MIDRFFIFKLFFYSQMKIEDEFDILKGFNQAASSIFLWFCSKRETNCTERISPHWSSSADGTTRVTLDPFFESMESCSLSCLRWLRRAQTPFFMWRSRFPCWVYSLPQMEHEKGFYERCVRTWSTALQIFPKDLSQMMQVRIWRRRFVLPFYW